MIFNYFRLRTPLIYINTPNVQQAIDAASPESVIILSGGLFNGFQINKKLKIVGAGYTEDSTKGTGRTIIYGLVDFGLNSSGSSISGMFFKDLGNSSANILIYPRENNLIVESIEVSRCYVPFLYLIVNSNASIVNCMFKENVIHTLNASGVTIANIKGISVLNNIVYSHVLPPNTLIANNILSNSLSYSEYRNNIFLNSSAFTTNTRFYNNVGGVNGTMDLQGNQGSGNFLDEDINAIFVKSNDADPLKNDYHLTKSYLNTGGTDGKPIGIYGGDGFSPIPSIPYIEFKEVAKQTNNQGQLPINFRVKARKN